MLIFQSLKVTLIVLFNIKANCLIKQEETTSRLLPMAFERPYNFIVSYNT